MFKTFQEYEAAAMALLQDKPKGTGFKNATGVVLLVCEELCYVEEGDGLDACGSIDASCWDDCTNAAEFVAVLNPVFVARFTPAEVAAHEAGEVEPSTTLAKTQIELARAAAIAKMAYWDALCALERSYATELTDKQNDAMCDAVEMLAASAKNESAIDDQSAQAVLDAIAKA